MSKSIVNLVAIGISTGGPKALQKVLTKLPADLNAPIVIVQHMPEGFTKSLANRLDGLCQIQVKEAEDGEELKNGVAYIAPGNRQLVLQQNRLGLGTGVRFNIYNGEKIAGHKPSVNVMMESLININVKNIICIIMTGMGNDGTYGLKELLSQKEVHVIAQDEESCTIYGMPKSIVEAGLSKEVKPLELIPQTIIGKMEVL